MLLTQLMNYWIITAICFSFLFFANEASGQNIMVNEKIFKSKQYKIAGDNSFKDYISIYDKKKPLLDVFRNDEKLLKKYENYLLLNGIYKFTGAAGIALIALGSETFVTLAVVGFIYVVTAIVINGISRFKLNRIIKHYNKIQYEKI